MTYSSALKAPPFEGLPAGIYRADDRHRIHDLHRGNTSQSTEPDRQQRTFVPDGFGVKGQVVGRSSAGMAARGFATLALTTAVSFESEGLPRNDESIGGKLADLRDAATFLAIHPLINATRLGVLGVCLGGGYALRAQPPNVAYARSQRSPDVLTIPRCSGQVWATSLNMKRCVLWPSSSPTTPVAVNPPT